MSEGAQSESFSYKSLIKAKEKNDKLVHLRVSGVVQGTRQCILLAVLTVSIPKIQSYEHCNPNKDEAEICNFKGRGLLNNFILSR